MYELHDISTLNVAGFETCTVRRDLSPLVKSGEVSEVPEAVLKAQWLLINSDWCVHVKDAGMQSYINSTDRTHQLVARIQSYTCLVETLKMWYYGRLAQYLRDEFEVGLDPDDKEQYNEDLDFVLIRLKEDEIELAHLEAAEKAKGETSGSNSNVDEGYFDSLIMAIYRYLFEQPAINLPKLKREMMTKELAIYLKELKSYKPTPKGAFA